MLPDPSDRVPEDDDVTAQPCPYCPEWSNEQPCPDCWAAMDKQED